MDGRMTQPAPPPQNQPASLPQAQPAPPSLRIVHVDTERTWRGGERQALLLARGLQRRGHQNVVACWPGGPLEQHARQAGLELLPLRARGEADLRAVARLRDFARARGADVLHAHTAHAHGLVALAGRGGLAARIVSRRVDFPPRGGLAALKYRMGFERIVAISMAIKQVLVESGVDPARVSVVPSGVEVGRCDGVDPAPLLAELGWAEAGGPTVGSIAALAGHKGLDVLVDAAAELRARHPGLRVVVLGEGEERARLLRRIQHHGLQGVVALPGFSPRTCELLRMVDVYGAPSRQEGLNTSLAEALAAGCPVVASRAGGIPELVFDGVTGLLVDPGDAAALAAALHALLSDRERAEALGAAGRRHVAAHFGVDAMVEGNLAVYRQVLAPVELEVP